MDDTSEIDLKQICCTCLSVNRKLFKLCNVKNGINHLYHLLSYDSEAYKEGFHKDLSSISVCWECRAWLRRISCFRLQACEAQKMLSSIVDGRLQVKSITSLTHICVTHKIGCDYTMTFQTAIDNFIDCSTIDNTSEIDDTEDVPLSTLKNQELDSHSTVEIKTEEMLNQLENMKKVKVEERKIKKKEKHDLVIKKENEIEVNLPEISKKRRINLVKDVRTIYGYKCSDCDMYFQDKNKKWKHIQRVHKEGFSCHTCGKRFAFKSNLTRHELLHTTPLPRKECPTCHKQIRVDLIHIHRRIHTQRETHSCAACDKVFVSRASFQHHLKNSKAHCDVPDILKFKCSMCEKGYRSRGDLRDHENYQHRGVTVHKCPICGKALATRRCITRHVRRAHEGIKENAKDKICQQCGKAFRDKKGLREHEFIHTGERPLSCEICGATFRQNASLYTHKRRVHKIQPPKRAVKLKSDET